MENNDLGLKKMNNKQEDNNTQNPQTFDSTLQSEIELNQHGLRKAVKRARHLDKETDAPGLHFSTEFGSSPSSAPEEVGKKMVENSDKNSDITSNRYPNSHPDNHENRGNLS